MAAIVSLNPRRALQAIEEVNVRTDDARHQADDKVGLPTAFERQIPGLQDLVKPGEWAVVIAPPVHRKVQAALGHRVLLILAGKGVAAHLGAFAREIVGGLMRRPQRVPGLAGPLPSRSRKHQRRPVFGLGGQPEMLVPMIETVPGEVLGAESLLDDHDAPSRGTIEPRDEGAAKVLQGVLPVRGAGRVQRRHEVVDHNPVGAFAGDGAADRRGGHDPTVLVGKLELLILIGDQPHAAPPAREKGGMAEHPPAVPRQRARERFAVARKEPAELRGV